MSARPAAGGARLGPWRLLALAALAAGAFLRLWQLGAQVLLDDEWHAIHKLLGAGMADIATHFGHADYSIPLTLYDRALFDLGWLTEWTLRLPMVVAALALLLVPLATRRLPPASRALWLALLALSPVLVYLGRVARPYALTCLLVLVAVVGFTRWWRGGRAAPRWGAAVAACTVLAAWLHLLTLAFTALPFLWFGVAALRRGVRRREWRPLLRLVGLGLAIALPLLALLLPPILTDWRALSSKAAQGQMTWHAAWRTLLMALGSARLAIALPLLGLAGLGAWRCARRAPRFTAYLAFVAVGGIGLILASEPNWIQHPPVLMRYALPVLPALLLLVAEGGAALLERLPAAAGAALGALALGVVFVGGPLPVQFHWPDQFMAHARYQFDPDWRYTEAHIGFDVGPTPAFYRALAQLPPGSVTVAEGPWRLESYYNPLAWYQQADRQWRKVLMTVPRCSAREWGEYRPDRRGIHLRQFVALDDVLAGRAPGVDYLVLNLQPWTDVVPLDPAEWPDMDACLASVTAALGAPDHVDAERAIFALSPRARAQVASGAVAF